MHSILDRWNRRRHVSPFAAAVGALVIAGAARVASAAGYSIQRVGLGPLSNTGLAYRLSDAGTVVGWATTPGPKVRAFVWTESGGGIELLADPSEGMRQAVGVNNVGQIVGSSTVTGAIRGILWNPAGSGYSPTELPNINDPSPNDGVVGEAINTFGTVVGNSYNTANRRHQGFIWVPSSANATTGTLASLGGGSGSLSVQPHDINDSGVVVGHEGQYQAVPFSGFIWKPTSPNATTGTRHTLAELPPDPNFDSFVKAINDVGVIVGGWRVNSAPREAFRWLPNDPDGITGKVDYLGFLPGVDSTTPFLYSMANDISDSGAIVGSGRANDGRDHAFLWTEGTGMQDLNVLADAAASGWRLETAFAVNASGWIVGQGFYDPDGAGGIAGSNQAFLVKPVPEPSLLAAIFVGMGAIRRRRH